MHIGTYARYVFITAGKPAMVRRVLFALLAVLPAAGLPAVAKAPQVLTQVPGYYRVMLGDDEVTALSDLTASNRIDQLMSDPAKARAVLARDHESLPITVSVNAFLINTGKRLVLIDTGTGAHLLANLRASGYTPDQVDMVLITHMHGDHIGGLLAHGKRVYRYATLYVNKRGADFWTSAQQQAAHPKRAATFEQVRAVLAAYRKAGKLHLFEGASTLFPGVRTVPAYGHTPGHTAYMIESRGKKLLAWGDIVHLGEVQFPYPDMTISYDSDPREAAATRRQLMAEAARQGYLVAGAHIAFPGIGHVRAMRHGYAWVPVRYNATVASGSKP